MRYYEKTGRLETLIMILIIVPVVFAFIKGVLGNDLSWQVTLLMFRLVSGVVKKIFN